MAAAPLSAFKVRLFQLVGLPHWLEDFGASAIIISCAELPGVSVSEGSNETPMVLSGDNLAP